MPITLTDTVGSASANTWADLAHYKQYLQTRLPLVTWLAGALSGTLDDQLKIDLIAAGRLMNNLIVWTGAPVDAVQAMTWPRDGMFNINGYAIANTTIPLSLKDAQCEYALQLHNGDLLSDDDAAKKNVKRVKAGSVEVEFQATDSSTWDAQDTRLTLLGREYGYLKVPSAARDLLVPSWYIQAVLSGSMEVEVNVF